MCASKRGILSVNLAQFYLGSVPLFACVGSLVTIRCYSLNESTEINIQRQKKRVKSRAGDSSLDRLQIRSRFSLWIESVSRSQRDVPALRFHSQIRSVTPVHQLYSASYSCRSRSGSFTVSTSAVSVWVVVEEGFTRLIASSDDAPSLPPLPACKCVRVSVPLSRLIHRDALSFLSSFLFSLQLVSVCLSFLSFYPPSVHLSRFFTCVLYVFNLIHSDALSLFYRLFQMMLRSARVRVLLSAVSAASFGSGGTPSPSLALSGDLTSTSYIFAKPLNLKL